MLGGDDEGTRRAVSRRRALLVLGGATAAGVVGGSPATAAVTRSQPGQPAGPDVPQYVFGYGSLIQTESRTRTVPAAHAAAPVVVSGISRGWYDQTGGASWNPAYLGAVRQPRATCNGVLYAVTAADIAANDQREVGYRRSRIEPGDITMLDGSRAAPDGDVWFYENTEQQRPSGQHPIVQSYVDLCVDGCLEVEAAYPLARDAGFAEEFIRTCTGWTTPWINDRIYPWRPFIYVPRADAIDALLTRVLGAELVGKIRLP